MIEKKDSVESIGDYAFYGCEDLTKVILRNPNTKYEKDTFPEHTKIIKKGVNENMKIKTNESINLKRAKRLREDSLDDVGTFRITMKDAETKYADVPFKVKGDEDAGEIDQIIYGDEFGDYFDENEIFTIASQPGKMHQLVRRAYMATNESINLRRAKKLLESRGYIVTKKGLKESDDPWSELESLGISEEEVDKLANMLGYHEGLTLDQALDVVRYIKQNGVKMVHRMLMKKD